MIPVVRDMLALLVPAGFGLSSFGGVVVVGGDGGGVVAR